jgi:hypothetical protein
MFVVQLLPVDWTPLDKYGYPYFLEMQFNLELEYTAIVPNIETGAQNR